MIFDQAVTGLYSMLRPLDDEAKDGAYFGNLYWEVCADVCLYKNSWTFSPGLDEYHGVNWKSRDRQCRIFISEGVCAISWSNTIIERMKAKQSGVS